MVTVTGGDRHVASMDGYRRVASTGGGWCVICMDGAHYVRLICIDGDCFVIGMGSVLRG